MKNSFSFLAKHISWKYIVLILILIYIILLTVPYLPHKTVSEEYKEKEFTERWFYYVSIFYLCSSLCK